MNELSTDPVTTETIQKAVIESATFRRRRMAFLKYVPVIWAVGMFVPLLFRLNFEYCLLFSASWLALYYVLFFSMQRFCKPKQASPIYQLLTTSDLSAIGCLIDVHQMLVPELQVEVQKTLIELLPQLKCYHAHYLNSYHRKCLRKLACPMVANVFLKTANIAGGADHIRMNLLLAIATLKAWESIGNNEDLKVVDQLYPGNKFSRSAPDLWEAAKACSSKLRVRLEQLQPVDNYLRSSSAPEELLRPASFAGSVDSATLLRSGAEPDEPDEQSLSGRD